MVQRFGQKCPFDPMNWHRLPWARLRGKRGSRWLRAVTSIVAVLATIHFIDQFTTYRRALAIKYSPTTFPRLSAEEQEALASTHWQWEHRGVDIRADSYQRDSVLASKADWTKLGRGFEGETFQYQDNVVKVFRKEHAPFRNCVPGWSPELRWPTEISASLILGGLGDGRYIHENASFLPVTDYFLSPETEGEQAKWHFLTPFLRLGTLEKLAKKLRQFERYRASDLDVIFRPSFDRLLLALHDMHTTYDLCHDDMKIDNIFLASSPDPSVDLKPNQTTHWLLGDLGNVREREHPYHTSVLWAGVRKNLVDCRANDVFRLVKVYLTFLRQSVDDVSLFDHQFFEGSQPWSRLFWSVSDDVDAKQSFSARSVLEQSATHNSPTSETDLRPSAHEPAELWNPLYRLFFGRGLIMKRSARDALKVRASETSARRWGLVPLLGVPYMECSAGTA